MSLAAVVDLYKKSDRRLRRKAMTNQNEFRLINTFVKATNKGMIGAVSEHDIDSYLERYREGSAYTFRNALASIKRLFAFAVKKKIIPVQ